MIREVGLIGDKHDLRLLAEKFSEGSIRISEEDGRFLMQSEEISAAPDAAAAREAVVCMLPLLEGAARLLWGIRAGIEAGGVEETNPDGSRHYYEYLQSSITARARLTATLTDAGGAVVKPPVENPVPNFMQAAQEHPAVLKVFHILRKTKWTWVDLYKIHEIIADDSGGIKGIAKRGWASKTEQDRFKHTSCSPSAAGDEARHAVEKTHPPSDPMTISQAKEFVRRLAKRWVESKASQSGAGSP